jgi:hypothetical protein
MSDNSDVSVCMVSTGIGPFCPDVGQAEVAGSTR